MQQVFEGKFAEKKVLIRAEKDSAIAEYFVNEELVETKHGSWHDDTSGHRKIVMEACDWLR